MLRSFCELISVRAAQLSKNVKGKTFGCRKLSLDGKMNLNYSPSLGTQLARAHYNRCSQCRRCGSSKRQAMIWLHFFSHPSEGAHVIILLLIFNITRKKTHWCSHLAWVYLMRWAGKQNRWCCYSARTHDSSAPTFHETLPNDPICTPTWAEWDQHSWRFHFLLDFSGV